MKLYICNISWNATESSFREWLTEVQGYVFDDLQFLLSAETGKPRGFAFVTFKNEEAGLEALRDLEGEELMGRPLHVSVARAKPRAGERRPQTGGPHQDFVSPWSKGDETYDWGDDK